MSEQAHEPWWIAFCDAHGRDPSDPDACWDWPPLRLHVKTRRARLAWEERPSWTRSAA